MMKTHISVDFNNLLTELRTYPSMGKKMFCLVSSQLPKLQRVSKQTPYLSIILNIKADLKESKYPVSSTEVTATASTPAMG